MDSANKGKIALTFALYQGEELLRRDVVSPDGGGIVKVGKDPRSHLRIDDELVSRMHAVIEAQSEADVTLIDLGNEPGTMVNGERVNKVKLRAGDQIQIGSINVVLEQVSSVAAEADAIPAPQPLAGTMVMGSLPLPPETAPVSQGAPPVSVQPASVPGPLVPPPTGPAFGVSDPGLRAAEAGSVPSAAEFSPKAAPVPAPAANPFAGVNPFAAASQNPFAATGAPANPFAVSNPFAAAAPPVETQAYRAPVDPNAPAASAYSLIKMGPDVNPSEVEVAHVASVEVIVQWDTNVLHVSHLTPPRPFVVGEAGGAAEIDYYLPSEVLGGGKVPIVYPRGSGVTLVLLAGATGTVELEPGRFTTLDVIRESGQTRPSSKVSGAQEFDLPAGAKARMQLANSQITFQVSAVAAGRPLPVGFLATAEVTPLLFVAMSFLLHVGIVAGLAFFMPSMGGANAEGIDTDRKESMKKYLNAAAEKELEQREPENNNSTKPDKEGGTGTRAKGEEGSMGNPLAAAANKMYGVQGPKDNPDPHIARQAAIKEAQQFGIIGMIPTLLGGGDPNAPTAPWGREDSSGQDDKSARGNMFGDSIGEAYGAGGLGLSGQGEGGGGQGTGIGLGNFGGLGHGAGRGRGQGFGDGSGFGRPGAGHAPKPPRMREAGVGVSGRLPPEVIQRVVRQNFGRFRACYEGALRSNPSLRGRVTTAFQIDRNGAVAGASNAGSDMPDGGVVACVVGGFRGLSFPAPEGGVVNVVYPIMFEPGE